MIYLNDQDFTLHQGDALEVLRSLPAGSVHMCVTSPPFYGLRDYGTGEWEGGEDGCDHIPDTRQGSDKQDTKWRDRAERKGYAPGSNFANYGAAQTAGDAVYKDVCGKCGARRVDQQIGLEQTPDEYVTRLVEVFREVRRVLRDDGTCWVELGDSYASNPAKGGSGPNAKNNAYGRPFRPGSGRADGIVDERSIRNRDGLAAPDGVKPKDLLGIPWLVAFALRADGWYLRSDIVWARPNPMPESVTDRPTKSHSYVFLLSKSARYFFDQEAIREKWADDRNGDPGPARTKYEGQDASGSHRYDHDTRPNSSGRNVRSVWTIPTQPLPDEHYAAFPERLAERCILAGSPAGGTVLDPFIGSGTVALVARRHGRRTIGIELSPVYCAIAARRTQQLSLAAGGDQ